MIQDEGRGEMDWQTRINRAIDYIEARLEGEVSWAAAAAEANCSTFHFLRMFEVVAGIGPGEYLRRRRLTRAALELAAGEARIIDVALRWGYDSPEAFGKAFRREFGMSPSEARRPGTRLKTWPRLSVSLVLKGSEAMEYRIENKEAFGITGLAIRVSGANGENLVEIPKFWQRANSGGQVAALAKAMPKASRLEVMGVCATDDPASETITYLIAIETPADRSGLPEGCVDLGVPASTWAVFPSRGPMPAAIQEVWRRIMTEWLPGSGYEHAEGPDLEVYPEGDTMSAGYYCEVWMPVRKTGR
jgi:AraC family transcriptional regulator